MISVLINGGLGNQLFEIFVTIAYALKYNHLYVFLNNKFDQIGYRKTFWESFLSKLAPVLIDKDNFKAIPFQTISEQCFSYNELPSPSSPSSSIFLVGYFQSEKYFKDYYHTICQLIDLETQKKTLREKLQLEGEKKEHDFENSISMHFRLGDYKSRSYIHPLMKNSYYINALYYLSETEKKLSTVYYFCEEEDIQEVLLKVQEIQHHFPSYNFILVENNLVDWEQMLFMSLCRCNIIGNSTFSWWGAYFNSWENKKVCYPSLWLYTEDTKDVCPEEWHKIVC